MSARAIGIVGMSILLAGCSANAAFPVFDREPDSRDVLPAEIADLFTESRDGTDLSTLRWVATDDGVDLYLFRDDKRPLCLVIANGPGSMLACSGGDELGASASGAGTYEVRPAPISEKDGWTVLSENVRVED